MPSRAVVLAAGLLLAPLGAGAADLVVWWERGYNPKENAALTETVAAFEQGTRKQVELVVCEQAELPGKLKAALGRGRPPDFAIGTRIADYIGQWAFDDRRVALADATQPSSAGPSSPASYQHGTTVRPLTRLDHAKNPILRGVLLGK